MPLPGLDLGLIVRYEYLWHRRKDAPTADKDHPACVIATFRNEGAADDFVVYLPISHTPPGQGEVGVELSAHAKRAAGLDSAPQWVLISECNIDTWPQDLRSLPGQMGRFHYGHLPPSEFRNLRDQFVGRYREKKVKQVLRYETPTPGM
jgi:hypothetical protein